MAHPHLALRSNRNVLTSHYMAGSKNPLALAMGSVNFVNNNFCHLSIPPFLIVPYEILYSSVLPIQMLIIKAKYDSAIIYVQFLQIFQKIPENSGSIKCKMISGIQHL